MGPIKLFHISDIHFGLEDPAALAWVEDCIASERPDAVAITGDLTMRARHKEFIAACKWISSLDVPVTVEIGNHETLIDAGGRYADLVRASQDVPVANRSERVAA